MYVKLKPVTHEFNNCVEGQVETIVEEYYHKNYLLTQLFRWKTVLDVVDGKIRIVSNRDFMDSDEIKQVGLRIEIVKCKDKLETLQKIKEELERNMPVIVNIQITNCPWDPNYGKEFVMEHVIILNGFDVNENAFLCCDATYSKEDALLPVEEFIAGCKSEYRKIVEFDKEKDLSSRQFNSLLENRAKEILMEKECHLNRLDRIGEFLIHNADRLQIREDHLDNVLFSETYMIIRDCAKVREMLVFLLKKQQGEKEHNLIQLFDLCMKKWLKIRILYVRASTSEKAEKYLISLGKLLYQIRDLEERIANYIVFHDINYVKEYLEMLPDGRIEGSVPVQYDARNENVIDLKPFYNNKAFGVLDDEEQAEFTSLGEYMIMPSEGFQFSLPDGHKTVLEIPKGMDNVICKNQKIPVNIQNVMELYVIGNTEYSANMEDLILELESGESEEVHLDFPEWYTEIINDEILIMKQDVIARENGKAKMTSFAGKIFLKRFCIQNKNIASIRLPKDGRIHIFQIVAYSNGMDA